MALLTAADSLRHPHWTSRAPKAHRKLHCKLSRTAELHHFRFQSQAKDGAAAWPHFDVGIKFADSPNGLAALPIVPAFGWVQIVGFCGYMDFFGANQRSDEEAGKLRPRLVIALTEVENETLQSYSFNAFGIPNGPKITDPVARKKKLAAEIANGRLAMMAIIGMFFQDGLTEAGDDNPRVQAGLVYTCTQRAPKLETVKCQRAV